jgi:preprotein translocase subunit SecD
MEDSIGPSLGSDSIKYGVTAALVGLLLVMGFMSFWYRFSGVIAVVALLFNIVLIIAALAIFGATLTLPGIAGIILTIGMSVDANVLIFERIREELRKGERLQESGSVKPAVAVATAINAGYEKAFITILDANITTLITAGVLYVLGTGPIRGFAVTLAIGIAASMFTALVVSRAIFDFRVRRRHLEKLSI